MIHIASIHARGNALLCAPSLLLLGVCALAPALGQSGKKYVRPAAPAADTYKESLPGNALAQEGGWKQATPQDAMLRGKWWEIFADPELNALEEKLNVDNQNIVVSFENFMAARAQVAQARASLWPTISVGATGSRSRTPALQSTTTASGIATTTNLFQLPINISWEPDLFGRVRAKIKQYSAAAQVSAADLENVRLSEQSSLAQYYFELRGQDALQQVYDANIENEKKSLELTQALYESGIDAQQDVVAAETSLRTAEANAVAVHTLRAQYEHAIALLIGQPAGNFSLAVKPLAAVPPVVPTGVASQLLERRPDIAAAERGVAELNALLGIGKAAYFPTISISTQGGTESPTWTNLFNWNNRYWSLGPTISQTIFDGGARKAALRQYQAQYEASVATYRQTALSAFKEVEDDLVASRQLAEQVSRQKLAVQSSARYRELALARYETGLDTYLNVVTAQTQLLNNQLTLASLQSQQMTATVQLIAALGGGWDASQLPTDEAIRRKP